jgi:hypothetical protein
MSHVLNFIIEFGCGLEDYFGNFLKLGNLLSILLVTLRGSLPCEATFKLTHKFYTWVKILDRGRCPGLICQSHMNAYF